MSFKQTVVATTRKLGLLPLLERSRYAYKYLKNFSENAAFRRAHPDMPLPPSWVMYDAYSDWRYEGYVEAGRKSAAYIHGLAERYADLPEGAAILDWGCGPGRIIRQWAELESAGIRGDRLFGADYNAQSIAWCQRNLPHITFVKNELAPPLPFEDNTFDFIYSFSVFTHLSEEMHYAWLAELDRVTKPTGVMLITLAGDRIRFKHTPDEREVYDRGELVVRGSVEEGSRMFAAFHSPTFARKFFGGHEILLHDDEQDVLGRQDVWLIRQRQASAV